MSSRFRQATRPGGVACILLPLALAGCGSQPPPTAPADIEVAVTPFPYNTDVEGRDLPVEIGRFVVPADRGDVDSGATLEAGYVRYPAAEGASGVPTVFLSAENQLATSRQRLLLDLREVADVVVFNRRGYGFSSPPPPCPGHLRYPFDLPLAQGRLQDALRLHAEECFRSIEAGGVPLSAYRDANVAGDLYDLARALGAARINLVVEGRSAGIAVLAVRRYPELVQRAVLVNPYLAAGVREEVVGDTPEPARRLAGELASGPLRATAASAAGQAVDLAIGELDLAFLAAGAMAGAESWSRVIGASESALDGDTGPLGQLTLDLRRRLGQPLPIRMIEALEQPAAAAPETMSNIEFAMSWPVSALEPRWPRGEAHEASQSPAETPVLVLNGTRHPFASAARQGFLADSFAGHRQIDVADGRDDLLDTTPGVADLLIRFLRGEPIGTSGMTSEVRSPR